MSEEVVSGSNAKLTRNNGNSPETIPSDQGFSEPMSALMAEALPLCPTIAADTPDQGFLVAKDWDEYDRLLALFDVGKGVEPEGPHADLRGELSAVVVPMSKNWISWFGEDGLGDQVDRHGVAWHCPVDSAMGREILARLAGAVSERTERRRRAWRKKETKDILRRDARVTVDSAIQRVASKRTADGKWLKTCEGCAHGFAAVRSNARFCSNACRNRAARKDRLSS